MWEFSLALLVSLLGVLAWAVGVLGLPGNWMIVGLATLSWALASPGSAVAVGIESLVALLVFAGLGELVEFLAGALGVQKLGGSTRSTWYALGGSIVGAVIGLFLGSGIPIIGNVIASVVGSALGALTGAVYGERTDGKHWEHSLQVGSAAFIGRILGTLSKLMCGTIMLIIFLAAIWL